MKDIVILGGGGFAREVCWLFEDINQERATWNVLGFIDEDPQAHGKELCDLPVLGDFGWFDRGHRPKVICGVGANRTRRHFAGQGERLGLEFASAVHPAARLSRRVTMGIGTVVCAGTAITTHVGIGNHVNLNLNCTVGHDVRIEDFCNASPGVHMSGLVHLESGVDLGTGAVVLPSVRIGRDSIIGAGAVVNQDVPALSVAVGVPAKVIRSLAEPGAQGSGVLVRSSS